MNEQLTYLIQSLDHNEYSYESEVISKHSIDWRKNFKGNASIVIFPKSIEKLVNVIKKCNEKEISVIPQGGNTSLVGGSVPLENSKKFQVIINFKKLNKIINFDPNSFSIQIESGCILEDIQNFLSKKNFCFPLSIGSRGNCQIGGNIASHAGGTNVIKYGTLRSNILGLEAVMADGSFFSSMKNVRKDNTGYDLKQLLIGSEGTLGLITAANIRVFPKPLETRVVFGTFSNIEDLLNFYSIIRVNYHDLLTSFELINNEAMELVIEKNNKKRILKKNNFYCLIELSNFTCNVDFFGRIEDFFFKSLKNSEDFIFSKSYEENKQLWDYRELIPIAETKVEFCINHDISIPLDKIGSFIKKTEKEVSLIDKCFKIINFGHIGDNNLHYNIFSADKKKNKKLRQKQSILNKIIFENVNYHGGTFSAEHGVGQLRIEELKRYKTSFEVEQMRKIKKIFDPKNILNPNKLFKN